MCYTDTTTFSHFSYSENLGVKRNAFREKSIGLNSESVLTAKQKVKCVSGKRPLNNLILFVFYVQFNGKFVK